MATCRRRATSRWSCIRHGVLIRSGQALQYAAQLKTIVLDKTGTITKGKPELTDAVPAPGFDEPRCVDREAEGAAAILLPHESGVAAIEQMQLDRIADQAIERRMRGKPQP